MKGRYYLEEAKLGVQDYFGVLELIIMMYAIGLQDMKIRRVTSFGVFAWYSSSECSISEGYAVT